MRITSVQINVVNEPIYTRIGGVILAIASIRFDRDLIVKNIRVIKTNDGRDVVEMPSVKTESGEYKSVAYPISEELRREIRHEVLEAVKRA